MVNGQNDRFFQGAIVNLLNEQKAYGAVFPERSIETARGVRNWLKRRSFTWPRGPESTGSATTGAPFASMILPGRSGRPGYFLIFPEKSNSITS
jgi:hypothetical protein